jgi:hypothetical protein
VGTIRYALPPAAPPSWCPSCGQPWETHWRCPPPQKRGIGKLNVLALPVGAVLLLESLLLAAYLHWALVRPQSTVVPRDQPAGSLRPRLQARELFYRWEGTHQTNFLNRAVADAHSPRVPWQSKVRLRTDLSGLLSSVREERYLNSPTTTSHYAHAVQADCARRWEPVAFRDRTAGGRVLADLACAIADGAQVISDFRVMGDQAGLFGPVASVPALWRA